VKLLLAEKAVAWNVARAELGNQGPRIRSKEFAIVRKRQRPAQGAQLFPNALAVRSLIQPTIDEVLHLVEGERIHVHISEQAQEMPALLRVHRESRWSAVRTSVRD
jgi:hypothetical protein